MKNALLLILCLLGPSLLAQSVEHDTSVDPARVETRTYKTKDGRVVTERITTTRIKETDTVTPASHFKAALFINNRAGAKFDAAMAPFEDLVTGKVTDKGFEVLSREVVADSMRSFDPQVASARRDPNGLDAQLTERSSALRLAQGLGADYLLVASITSIGTKERGINAYGVKMITKDTTMRVSYKILDGHTGGSITAGTFAVTASSRQSANAVEKDDDVYNELLDQASTKIADSLESKVADNRIRPPSEAPSAIRFTVKAEAADLMIPDVRIGADHTVSISDNSLKVAPVAATVEIDGVAIGTAPGSFSIAPGFHKLRVSREGFIPWERTINAVDGQSLTVALRLSEAQYQRWKDATAFINGLKNGAKLTDAQVKVLEGAGKMLEQSGFKVNTKDAPGAVYHSIF